ncbi:WD repeat-containing protein 18 [Parasteatoda tepidariorum]|uniref:WD repeat-containing protein 18 n=1 Tax=Parasteatoda tepidariorum TaxID=114398 RepID=UPI00077FC4B4|nr:WD repeat-containing protein 18 [Parasteatoda tepidariorum]XP_042904148.1 WD repeat-containing protein 18 [Parasteatoda tepidariorum]
MGEPNWDFNEVIITSSGNFVSVLVPKTGKVIKNYSMKTIAPKCLALLGEDYFIGASINIPDIKMWPVGDDKSVSLINSPCGLVTALTVSNCGTYCVAAFRQEIRVWNVQTGEMLTAFTRHYQDVTVLKFTSDDAAFISGGKDGHVQTWILSKVTCANLDNPNRVKPLHSWRNHTKEITDIFVGSLGMYSRIATTSADMTCRLYELNSGLLLTSVCLDIPITSVTIDSLEYYLILGTQKGTISKINLYYEQPREIHNNPMDKEEINAHGNAVISLSMSIVGDKFVSISLDSKLKLWDVATLTCILSIPCSDGHYRNAFFTLYPAPLLTDEEPYIVVKQLERIYPNDRAKLEKDYSVLFRPQDKELSMICAGSLDNHYPPALLYGLEDPVSEATSADTKKETLYQEAFRGESVSEVREMNAQMYSYMLDQVFKSIDPAIASSPLPPVEENK